MDNFEVDFYNKDYSNDNTCRKTINGMGMFSLNRLVKFLGILLANFTTGLGFSDNLMKFLINGFTYLKEI